MYVSGKCCFSLTINNDLFVYRLCKNFAYTEEYFYTGYRNYRKQLYGQNAHY